MKLRAMIAHPALAYLLVLVLLYPAYRGLFRKPEVVTVPVKEIVEVEKPTPGATFLTFKLEEPVRGAGQRLTTVRLAPDEKFFALSFFVPISSRPEFVYEVEVRDSQERVVMADKQARAQDSLGNFSLMCPRDLFSSGKYELRVKEVNKTTQAVRGEFKFSFVVAER